MLVDHSLRLGATALDLEEAGVGALAYPLQVTFVTTAAISASTTFKVTHCATSGGQYADLAAVGPFTNTPAGAVIQFELPADSKRYVKCSPTDNVEAFLTIGKQAFKAMPEAASLKSAFVQEQSSD